MNPELNPQGRFRTSTIHGWYANEYWGTHGKSKLTFAVLLSFTLVVVANWILGQWKDVLRSVRGWSNGNGPGKHLTSYKVY